MINKLKQNANVGALFHIRPVKENNGITLIALIITIIVMLILVGVTVNVALTGGLFTKASDASKQMQIEAEKEELLSSVVAAIGYDGKVVLEDIELPNGWKGTNGTYTSPKGNTYTVDENGKIGSGESKPKKEGNEVIAQILTNLALKEITEEEAVQQLKQELSIEDEEIEFLGGIAEVVGDEIKGCIYIYIKKADEVYVGKYSNNLFSYADEETYKKQYNLLRRGFEVMREELANVFIGTTSAEMLEKFNNGTLEDYVLEKSDIITAIEVRSCSESRIDFNYVTIYEGEDEATLLWEDNGYTITVRYENGNYSYVDIHDGN